MRGLGEYSAHTSTCSGGNSWDGHAPKFAVHICGYWHISTSFRAFSASVWPSLILHHSLNFSFSPVILGPRFPSSYTEFLLSLRKLFSPWWWCQHLLSHPYRIFNMSDFAHCPGVCLHCFFPRPLDGNCPRQSRTAQTSEVGPMIPSKAPLASRSAMMQLEALRMSKRLVAMSKTGARMLRWRWDECEAPFWNLQTSSNCTVVCDEGGWLWSASFSAWLNGNTGNVPIFSVMVPIKMFFCISQSFLNGVWEQVLNKKWPSRLLNAHHDSELVQVELPVTILVRLPAHCESIGRWLYWYTRNPSGFSS